MIRAATPTIPAGTLCGEISNIETYGLVITYFRRKIHLQLPESLISPPRIGPRRRETAKTTDTRAPYMANLSGGTSSKKMAMQTEYIPEPPIPCSARNTILEVR